MPYILPQDLAKGPILATGARLRLAPVTNIGPLARSCDKYRAFFLLLYLSQELKNIPYIPYIGYTLRTH